MAKKQKKASGEIMVPKSLEEVGALQLKLADRLRRKREHEAVRDAERDAISEKAKGPIAALEAEILDLARAIYTYGDNHKDELLRDKKTVEIPRIGSLSWSLTPPAIEVVGDTKAIVKYLSRRKLKRFIRVTVEINKEALGNELDVAKTIPDIRIRQDNIFTIKLEGAPERVSRNTAPKSRWKITVPKSR